MFFPYTSSYMHLFKRNGMGMQSPFEEYSSDPYQHYGSRPWNETASQDSGFDSDADRSNRRRTLGAGLSALGVGLLESAGTGDWSTGLARGMSGFSQATAAEKERLRRDRIEEEERQQRQRQEARINEQERDRNESHDIDVRRGNSEFEAWQSDRARDEDRRARVGKSAEQMAAEIQSLAAENPNDPKLQAMAKRAAGYALGDDSDLDKLASLHNDMLTRAYEDEDYDKQTQAGIRRTREEIAAGVVVNPVEAARRAEARANEQLAISRGHLSIDRERANREAERPTPLQTYDRLERRVAEKLEAKVQQWRSQAAKLPAYSDKEADDITPPAGKLEQWRQEAIREAQAEFERSMDSVMEYTATGQLIPR